MCFIVSGDVSCEVSLFVGSFFNSVVISCCYDSSSREGVGVSVVYLSLRGCFLNVSNVL